MSKIEIEILEETFEVEFDFKITAASYGGSGPSFTSPGEPPEPCEFDILSFEVMRKGTSAPLELPKWLETLVSDHLYGSDEVYEIVAESESEEGDYDNGED